MTRRRTEGQDSEKKVPVSKRDELSLSATAVRDEGYLPDCGAERTNLLGDAYSKVRRGDDQLAEKRRPSF